MRPAPLPFVQSIPHAGLSRPPELDGQLRLDDVALFNECDLWADQLFDFGHASLDAGGGRGALEVVTTPIARAIVDVNRSPDDLDNPDGVIKAQTSYGVPNYDQPLADAEKRSLRDRYWGDYHTRLAHALDRHRAACRLLLDCHNMAQIGPSTYAHPGKPRPLVCLANLGNQQGESVKERVSCPPWLLRRAGAIAADLFAGMRLLEPAGAAPPVVALNYPFKGGYIVSRYSVEQPDAPYGIMVEINRGLFVGNQTAERPIAPPDENAVAAIRKRLYAWALALEELLEQAPPETEHA